MSYKTFVNRNNLLRLIAVIALALGLLIVNVLTSPAAYAQDAKCNGVATAIDYGCTKSNDEIKGNPIFSLLLAVINFLAIGVGVAVVGGVVYGAIRYIAANGNGGKVQEAIKIITNAVLALVLFAFMYAIINFLVPGGVFN